MEKMPKITTPLTVIGAFLALVEAIALATLSTVSGDIQIILTYFVILFPVLVSIAFLYTLWFRPYVFYPPSEYGERTSVTEFVDAIMQQPQHRDEQLIAINRLSIAKLVSEKADDEIIQSHEIIIETQQQENINRNDDWMMPFNEGNYQEAINLIAVQKEIATEDSDIFVLSYYSAVALTYLDFNKAFVEFRKLIDEAPFVSFPYAALADAYERMNLTKEELEVVEQAIERISDETKPEFLLRKARILLKQKETDAAIKLALEVGKTSDPIIRSHVYRLLGQINMQQGNSN